MAHRYCCHEAIEGCLREKKLDLVHGLTKAYNSWIDRRGVFLRDRWVGNRWIVPSCPVQPQVRGAHQRRYLLLRESRQAPLQKYVFKGKDRALPVPAIDHRGQSSIVALGHAMIDRCSWTRTFCRGT